MPAFGVTLVGENQPPGDGLGYSNVHSNRRDRDCHSSSSVNREEMSHPIFVNALCRSTWDAAETGCPETKTSIPASAHVTRKNAVARPIDGLWKFFDPFARLNDTMSQRAGQAKGRFKYLPLRLIIENAVADHSRGIAGR